MFQRYRDAPPWGGNSTVQRNSLLRYIHNGHTSWRGVDALLHSGNTLLAVSMPLLQGVTGPLEVFPGGVVRSSGLASEGVRDVCYCR